MTQISTMVVVAAVVLLAIYLSETKSFPLGSVLSKRVSHARSNVGLLRASTLSGDDVTSSSFTALTKDGGVKKMRVDRGTGKKIETGDILAVAFEAKTTEGGVVFAKGEKEKFVYADGSFIKGWDIGVGSMKVGESAKFSVKAPYAYGNKGVSPVVPPDSDLELEVKILAWLGNQMKPESLFQKDLDIDPFIASSPEAIQADYDDMQESFKDKYEGNILEIYLRRIKNISFGFGGSGFFQSQSGERPPWYLNPNLTFPAMILFSMGTFAIVFLTGSIKEKGERAIDPDLTMATPPPSIMNQYQHLQDGYVVASGKQSLPAIPEGDVFA